jgi:hypothetical protein
MELKDLLIKNSSRILDKWFYLILDTYPPETAQFLKREQDRFSNPVAATISTEIQAIYDELLTGDTVTADEPSPVAPFLDNIIRIRAIQDFTPSQAISFIFLLKNVIRDELNNEIMEYKLADEMMTFESRIDKLALLSFDIFMKCREQLYEIKANEVKSNVFRLLQRADILYELSEEERHREESYPINFMKRGESK